MQVIYKSDNYEVREYGTQAVFMVLDRNTKQFVVFEDYRQSGALIDVLQAGINSGDDMTDIYLGGLIVLAKEYNND